MTLDLVLPSFHFALKYAQKLIADIPDERWTGQPVQGVVMNHAAWTLGHIAWANDNMLRRLNQTPALGEDWRNLFMMGTKPLPDRSAYPSAEVLLRELQTAHDRLLDAATHAPEELLTSAPTEERMQRMFPTIGNMLAGLMTSHYAAHNGQLSAWRRAMGFGPAF